MLLYKMGEMKYSQWVLERVGIVDKIRLREGKTSVGRSPLCTIKIKSSFSSRIHSMIEIDQNGRITIEDFSSNGTYVNTVCYRAEKVELADGDRIGIGCEVSNSLCRSDENNGNYWIFILRKMPMKSCEQSGDSVGCVGNVHTCSVPGTSVAKIGKPKEAPGQTAKETHLKKPNQPSTSGTKKIVQDKSRETRGSREEESSESEDDLPVETARRAAFDQQKELVDKQISSRKRTKKIDDTIRKEVSDARQRKSTARSVEHSRERFPSTNSHSDVENKSDNDENTDKKMFSSKNQLKNISKSEKEKSRSRDEDTATRSKMDSMFDKIRSSTLVDSDEEKETNGKISERTKKDIDKLNEISKSRKKSVKKVDRPENNLNKDNDQVPKSKPEKFRRKSEKEPRKSSDNKGPLEPDKKCSLDINRNLNRSVSSNESTCKVNKTNESHNRPNKSEQISTAGPTSIVNNALDRQDVKFTKDQLTSGGIDPNKMAEGSKPETPKIDVIVIISDDDDDEVNDKNLEKNIETLNPVHCKGRRKSENKDERNNSESINSGKESEKTSRRSEGAEQKTDIRSHFLEVREKFQNAVPELKEKRSKDVATKISKVDANKSSNNEQDKLDPVKDNGEIHKLPVVEDSAGNKDEQEFDASMLDNLQIDNIQNDLEELDALITEIKTEIIETDVRDVSLSNGQVEETVYISDDENDMHLSQSLIRDIKQEMVDMELEESFGLERMKEEPEGGDKDDKMMSPIFEIGDDDDDDFEDTVCKWALKLSQNNLNDSKTKPETLEKRKVPEIITPPSLPTKRGKLRGVSAETPSKRILDHVANRTRSIREKDRATTKQQELKKSWLQKPSLRKRDEKEEKKKLQEERKLKLKELADEQAYKRKLLDDDDVKIVKKPKVKVTVKNRGAFLTEDISTEKLSETSRENKKPKLMKIPKVSRKDNGLSKENTDRRHSLTTAIPSTSKDYDGDDVIHGRDTLAELKIKHRVARVNLDLHTDTQKSSDVVHDVHMKSILQSPVAPLNGFHLPSHNKNANGMIKERDTLAELKIKHRVARVSSDFQGESHKNLDATTEKNHVQMKSIPPSSPNDFQVPSTSQWRPNSVQKVLNGLKSILKSPDAVKRKSKKTVKFNDVPKVVYIEIEANSGRRVDQKDASIDLSFFVTRPPQRPARRPMRVDYTEKILSEILSWNPKWLETGKEEINDPKEVLLPVIHKFSSFEEFKRILFPLMKLEFWASLAQEFLQKKSLPYITIRIEGFKAEKRGTFDRFVYYCDHVSTSQKDSAPLNPGDLCIIKIDARFKSLSVFAFVESIRKIVSTQKLHYSITLQSNVNIHFKELVDQQKTVKVKSVSSIRVDLGAFNAVHNLSFSPLLKAVLDPHILASAPEPAIDNIRYRGCYKLNIPQEKTLLKIYMKCMNPREDNICLIEGPPGTGKSYLIANLAMQILYGDPHQSLTKKILICSQSNTAIDVIVLKLLKIRSRMTSHKFKFARFGILERMHPHVRCVSVQKQVQNYFRVKGPDSSEESLQREKLLLESQIEALNLDNANGSNNINHDELHKLKQQLEMVNRILNQKVPPDMEKNLFPRHIQGAHIVCTTLSSCVKLLQYTNYFDVCIIDEATQCLEPWTLIPMQFNTPSLVLVGDTQQLPGTVLSKTTSDYGFGQSLFTRIEKCSEIGKQSPICRLEVQYRMHPEISKWPNSYFYKNRLVNDKITTAFKVLIKPYSVLNLEFEQDRNPVKGQICNSLEARFVVDLVVHLSKILPPDKYTYGVITPYTLHRDKINIKLREAGIKEVSVNTIDSYQGKEKDVIIISNARTIGVGFLSNCQRLNVAMTRASKCLILCGNFSNVQKIPVWKSLLDDAKRRSLYYHIRKSDALDFEKNIMKHLKVA